MVSAYQTTPVDLSGTWKMGSPFFPLLLLKELSLPTQQAQKQKDRKTWMNPPPPPFRGSAELAHVLLTRGKQGWTNLRNLSPFLLFRWNGHKWEWRKWTERFGSGARSGRRFHRIFHSVQILRCSLLHRGRVPMKFLPAMSQSSIRRFYLSFFLDIAWNFNTTESNLDYSRLLECLTSRKNVSVRWRDSPATNDITPLTFQAAYLTWLYLIQSKTETFQCK